MADVQFIVTAEIMNRDESGSHPEGGRILHMNRVTKKTWGFSADATIGEIMKSVDAGTSDSEYVLSITVTEDRAYSKRERAAEPQTFGGEVAPKTSSQVAAATQVNVRWYE